MQQMTMSELLRSPVLVLINQVSLQHILLLIFFPNT